MSAAAAAAYGATVMPLIDGGSVYLLLGGDVVSIVLGYCDAVVIQFIDLHRAPKSNPLLIDQLITDFQFTALAPAPTASSALPHTPFVARLSAQMHGIATLTESAAGWNSLSHAKLWYQQLTAELAAHERRIYDLESRERFRYAVREYVNRKPANASVASVAASAAAASDDDKRASADSPFLASLETAQLVARAMPALALSGVEGDALLAALQRVDIRVDEGTRTWQPARWNDDAELWNALRMILRFGHGLAPVCVDVLCSSAADPPGAPDAGPNEEFQRHRHQYSFAIAPMPHDERDDARIDPGRQSGGRAFGGSEMRFLFRCAAVGDYTRPPPRACGPDGEPLRSPAKMDTAAAQDDDYWTFYRTRDQSGLRIDDWKRGKSFPPGSCNPDAETAFQWSDAAGGLVSAPAAAVVSVDSKVEFDAGAAIYAKLDSEQWTSLMLRAAACVSAPCLQWRAAFRALTNHKRVRTVDESEHRS